MSMWKDIVRDPPPKRDATGFIALGDTEIALVWWEPEGRMTWKIMNIPGRGVRLGDILSTTFHSWCWVSEFHRGLNMERNPEYYGKG